jgi:hypothetical protein
MEFDKIIVKKVNRGGIRCVSYILQKDGCTIIVTDYNIHIEDSYKISKRKDIIDIMDWIYDNYDNKVIQNRTKSSCINEWIAHNNLYKLGLFKSHTVSVDIDYPQKWYMPIIYKLLSLIVL